MKKRIISILLAMVMVLSTLPISALAENVNETADKVNEPTAVTVSEGPIPEIPIPDLEKALISTAIKQIPYVGAGAAGALDSTLNDILGIDAPTIKDLRDAIQSLSNQIYALSQQLDKATSEILTMLYDTSTYNDFNSKMTGIQETVSGLYNTINSYLGNEKMSPEFQTFMTAQLIKFGTTDQSELDNVFNTLIAYINGTNIAGAGKVPVKIFQDTFRSSCNAGSFLGGEAALRCAPYVNRISDLVSSIYALFLVVARSQWSLCENYAQMEAAAAQDQDFKLQWDAHKMDYTKTLERTYQAQYENIFSAYNAFFNDEGSYVQEYNQFVKDHWFDYIRDTGVDVDAGQIVVTYIPLDRTLNTIHSSDESAFGVNWRTKGADVEDMLDDAVDYAHKKITPAITIAESEGLLNHIIDNTTKVYLPEETNDTGIRTFTLFELLKNYGFEIPDTEGLNPYVIHNTEYEFKEYREKDHQPPEFKYKGHFYINGLNCSDNVGYSYDQKGDLITAKEGYTKNRYYYYRRKNSNDEDLWSTYPNELYYYFAPAPLELNTEQDFVEFIQSIANGKDYWGYTVNLNTDVDINVDYSTLWPKDKNEKEFRGTFDGNNHTISNLNDTSGSYYGGLFHILGNGAAVINLTLDNVTVSTTHDAGALASTSREKVTINNVNVKSGSITGKNSVAGLIGWLQKGADISNCSNGTTVNGGQYGGGIGGCLYNRTNDYQYIMKNCSNTGSISATDQAGGIAGCLETDNQKHDFSDCTNTGNVTANNDNAGGIVGKSYGGGYFTNCKNSGSVKGKSNAGGIVGWNEDDAIDFTDSKNEGAISGATRSGGIIGCFGGSDGYKFVRCTNTKSVTGANCAGGIVGWMNNGSKLIDYARCKNSGAITQSAQGSGAFGAGGIAGVVKGGCHLTECENTGNIHAYYSAGGIVGYVDTNTDQNLHNSVNEGDVTADANCAGGMVGQSYGGGNYTDCWNQGEITGKFAGGIIGWNQDDAIDFSGSRNRGDIYATNNGGEHGGGIAGYLGHIDHDDTYIGRNCYNQGYVTATKCAGGIIGYLYSDASKENPHVFSSCSNFSRITSDTDCAGGIIGANYGFGDFTYCSNEDGGNVTAKNDAGGIIGWNQNDTIDLRYATNSASISGGRNSGELYGYSGGSVVTVSIRDKMANYKADPKSLTTEEIKAILKNYDEMAQDPAIRAEMEADAELQAWIAELRAKLAEEQSKAKGNAATGIVANDTAAPMVLVCLGLALVGMGIVVLRRKRDLVD